MESRAIDTSACDDPLRSIRDSTSDIVSILPIRDHGHEKSNPAIISSPSNISNKIIVANSAVSNASPKIGPSKSLEVNRRLSDFRRISRSISRGFRKFKKSICFR